MAVRARPLLARVLGAAVLLTAGLVALAAPASAAESGTLTLRAACPFEGQYSAGVWLDENFNGLVTVSPHPGYSIAATRDHESYTDTISDSSWYPDTDGTHVVHTYEFAYDGVGPTPVVAPGDSWHWKLIKTYGEQTTVLQGDTVVQEATGCGPSTPPPPQQTLTPPAPASFGSSPHKVTVDHHGKFTYTFGGGAGVGGTIVVAVGGKTWAHGSFVVPATGTDSAGLKLTKKARHYLASHHKAKSSVTVVLSNAYGSTSSGTSLKLRWA